MILINISLVLRALTSYYMVVGHLNEFCNVPHSVSSRNPVGMLGFSSYRFARLYMFRNQHLSWLTMIECAFLPSENHAEISLLWWQCWAVGPHGRFVLCGWELMGTCFSLGNRLLTMWLWLPFSLANTSDFFSIFAVGISGFTKSCNTWPSSLELGLFSLQNYEQNKAKQNLFSLYITQSGIFWYGNRESTQIGLYETAYLVGYLSSLCFSSCPSMWGSEDNMQESILFFHHGSSGDQAQVSG